MQSKHLCLLACSLAYCAAAVAQQYVYPSKNQSPETQRSDEAACHTWAVQQTGFDPGKATAAAPEASSGPSRGSGARGAARGAVVGEIVADDASTGAAVGAVAARGQSRRQNAAAAQQQGSATQTQQSAYDKARATCLEGRGYSVK